MMNSSVLQALGSHVAVTGATNTSARAGRMTVLCAQQQQKAESVRVPPQTNMTRFGLTAAAALFAAAALVVTAAPPRADATILDEYLDRSKANKELNDKKRLATSGANFARAYTVQFGSCKFPENFTGCQDLAKQKNVPFLSDDLKLECEGKEKYKCGSNVFWKW